MCDAKVCDCDFHAESEPVVCKCCGATVEPWQWHWRKMCARRNRRADTARGIVRPFYVVAYAISRAYVHRDGGYYADTLRILEVRRVWSVREGVAAGRALKAEYPTCPRGRGSVLGGDDVYVRCYHAPEHFPGEDW